MAHCKWCRTEIDEGSVIPECEYVAPVLTKVAVKFDGDKDPWQYVPWDAVRAISKVLRFGANKYAPRNWEKGFDVDRLFRAAIEHMVAWFHREDSGKGPGIDKETGYSHLWHAGCCILFLIAHELRGIGVDNRPLIKEKNNDSPS